jgi:hypothetical protein
MSDPTALPPPEPEPPSEPEPSPQPPPATPRPRRRVLPWLTGAGFLILAIAIAWVWQNPIALPTPSPGQDQALVQQIAALQARIARLEQRPQPQPPDLAPLEARVAALENRPPLAAATTAPDLSQVTARLDAVERRQQPDLAPLQSRIASLEDAGHKALSDMQQRLSQDNERLSAVAKAAGLAARVSAARQALDAGQKLGNVTGAPPALARYAEVDPPTEASLRLAFPVAEQAALAASRPSVDDKPLLARLWARAQDLVTIRQGDRVLVGDPAAGVLARAQEALDAGDLAGAVRAVSELQGAAAQAMAGWHAQARALLQARAALATWATQG